MDKDEYSAWPPQRAARFGGRAEDAARREDPLGAAAPTRPAGFPPLPPVDAAGCDRYITALSGPVFAGQEEWYRRGCMRLCLFGRQRRCLFLPVAPAGLFGGWCRRMHLYQPSRLFGVFRAVSAGYFALGGKVTKTPPGFPRTPFCPIGRLRRYSAQPLKRRF